MTEDEVCVIVEVHEGICVLISYGQHLTGDYHMMT